MNHVIRALSNWLIKHDAINPADRELYEYAIYSSLISITPLVIFLIVSGVIEMLLEGVLIIIPFMITRKFSGGYHAKHAASCMLISVGLLGVCLYVVAQADNSWLFHILIIISGLSVACNSPIDSENKKLVDDEKKEYKHITYLIVIIMVVVYAVLSFIQMERYAVCLSVSLALSSLLQLPCILKKYR